MPYSLRWSIAIAALGIAWLLWLFIFNGPVTPTTTTATVGVCIMVAAFLLLGVLRTDRSLLLPLWISLGIVLVWSAMIILSLAGRPAGLTPLIVTGVSVLAIGGGMLIRPRPRIALGLLMVLGALGAYGLLLVPVAVSRFGGAGFTHSAAPPVGMLGAACVAAAWHAVRARSRRDASGPAVAL